MNHQILLVALIGSGSAFALTTLFLVVGDYQLVRRLRRDHAAMWKSIGSPSPWFSRWEDLSSISRFLNRRQYQQLDDANLAALGRRLRVLTNAVYCLAASTLLLSVLARRLHGR